MERIVVVGVGYVGLVAAACFASIGHTVVCVDIDEKKIDLLRKGHVPFFEPKLEKYVSQGIENKRLFFTTSYTEALENSSFAILAVDTPQQANGSCNTTNIFKAAESIGQALSGNLFVIVKSTVPVGTCERLEKTMLQVVQKRHVPWSVEVISNPEFLKEGAAVSDFLNPDRLIIGVQSEQAEEMIRRLYTPFHHAESLYVVMDRASSELTKYASNTMLALRISFMNWLSELCEKTGADIESIRLGIGSDKRIGSHFLRSGIGFGGSCFPKDIQALAFLADSFELNTALIKAIDDINEWQKKRFAQHILDYLVRHHKTASSCHVALLGLSFKAHTDDMRKAPSLTVIRELLSAGVQLHAYDPIAIPNAKQALLPKEVSAISWHEDPLDAVKNTHAIALLTEWPTLAQLPLQQVRASMKGTGLFDGRSVFKASDATGAGFDYFCLGKHMSPYSVQTQTTQVTNVYV